MDTPTPAQHICHVCGLTLQPGWELVLGALIVGVEAAAYATLVICSFFLVSTAITRAVRRVLS